MAAVLLKLPRPPMVPAAGRNIRGKVMIDVTPIPRPENFAGPVLLTPAVWEILNGGSPDSREAVKRRLGEVYWTLGRALQRKERGDLFDFCVWIDRTAQKKESLRLRAVLNRENSNEPTIAIQLPGEN